MALDTYTVLVFAAGALFGVAITLLASITRDLPWLLRILYRRLRHRHELPQDALPPSLKPYLGAYLADVRRRHRA